MKHRIAAVTAAIGTAFFACSAPDDTCRLNSDCVGQKLCNPEGSCVEAERVAIRAVELASALVGEAYSFPLQATGGIPPYRWSLDTKGEPRLAWLEIDPASGILRSKAGELPSAYARDLRLEVTVKDSSNRGEGESNLRPFDLSIDECRGVWSCFLPQQGACHEGRLDCIENKLAEVCSLTGYSISTEHCGPDCSACPEGRANQCKEGVCACGSVAVCEDGLSCCDNFCTDLKDDTAHCGACQDSNCNVKVANAVGVKCSLGLCDYDDCLPGWLDCDSNRQNGCEQAVDNQHCGGCSDDCTALPHVTVGSCLTTADPPECAIGACEAPWLDCTDDAGCETAGATEANCGGCGVACSGDTPRCLSIDGQLRCGCAETGQCDSNELCCGNVCVMRDRYHCADCTSGCSIATGGLFCSNTTGTWSCECSAHEDCRGPFDFSLANCSSSSHHCYCSSPGTNCDGTVTNICCEVPPGGPACTSLLNDVNNCGVCGRVCKGSNTCSGGACSCANDNDCPIVETELWHCVSNRCVCSPYNITPCPPGQYCCNAKGCCTKKCSNANENTDCSDGCFLADPANIWCYWGCCDMSKCSSQDDCAANQPEGWPF